MVANINDKWEITSEYVLKNLASFKKINWYFFLLLIIISVFLLFRLLYPTQKNSGFHQYFDQEGYPPITLGTEQVSRSRTADEIMAVFKMLNEKGKTIVIVAHDLEIARQCDRIIKISDGNIYGQN